MKKNTKIIATVCIAALLVIAAVFVILHLPQEGAINLPDGAPPQWQVKVTGNVEQEKTWSINEISKMPLKTVITKANGENVTYIGVELYEFCNRNEMLWDAGPIEITSSDGNRAILNVFQSWNSTVYPYFQEVNRITLVFVKDGQWMTESMGGPVKLIVPYFSKEHQIEHVSEMNIDHWTVSISGAVENPITISGKNITALPETTVEAEFAPGSGTRTSNWTGISLMDLLEAANTSYRAGKITVVAVDEYSNNYTLWEVESTQMMLGYKENGVHLPQDSGGPFRLMLPIEEYKWARFWVKFVTQIIVS